MIDVITPVASPILNGLGQAAAPQVVNALLPSSPQELPPPSGNLLEARYARAQETISRYGDNPDAGHPSWGTQALFFGGSLLAAILVLKSFERRGEIKHDS
jgi:hypothetical protein